MERINIMKAGAFSGAFRHKRLVLLASTAMGVFASNPALAQEQQAEVEEEEVIVVSGIRAALENARATKRDADTFVDSISASDANALPDLSVTEALARLPGVVVQRFGLGGSDGDFPSPEGVGNTIRGLQFSRTEFNGRDSFSADGGRQLDFSTITPELIGRVDVFKNSTADQIEGGIAGTINLQTVEPLNRKGFHAAVNLEGTYTDLRNAWSPSGSIQISNTWDTDAGTFGLLGSVSYSELASRVEGFQIGQLLALDDPRSAVPGQYVGVPGGFQLRTNDVDRERQSYYLAGQWRSASGNFEATAKYVRVDDKENSNEQTLEWFTDGESFDGTEILSATYTPFTSAGVGLCNGSNAPGIPGGCENLRPIQNGLFESGTLSNSLRDWTGSQGANFSNLAINNYTTSKTEDYSLNLKWRPSDQWFVSLDGQYTKAESSLQRLWAGTQFFADFALTPDLDNPEVSLFPAAPAFNGDGTQRFTQRRAGNFPTAAELAGPGALASLNNNFPLFAADQFADNEGELYALKGDVEYEFDNDSWYKKLKFGARYSSREQTNRTAGLNWASIAPPWQGGGFLPYSSIANAPVEVVDFSNFFGGGVVTGDNTNFVFADRNLLRDYDGFLEFLQNPLLNSPDGSIRTDFQPLRNADGVVDYAGRGNVDTIKEQTYNAYARLDFGQDFDNGSSITGNIGMRYVRTDTATNGGLRFSTLPAQLIQFNPQLAAIFATPVNNSDSKRSDEYWLPSLNLKWAMNDEMIVRFAMSKQITRPNVSDLKSSRNARVVATFVTTGGATPTVIDVIPTQLRVEGANPSLAPVESINYDLSYEWYFPDGYFSLSLFRKELSNIIINSEEAFADPALTGQTQAGIISLDGNDIPVIFAGLLNQDKGTVQGLEVSYQHFFKKLPGILGNLGVQANYTYIDSSTTAPPAFVDQNGDGQPDAFGTTFRWGINDLLGLSEHSYNLVGIYQDSKLEMRIAYNWRSEFVRTYRDFITGNPIIQGGQGDLSASIKYNITDNLQFKILGANLTSSRSKSFQQIDQAGQRFGRDTFLGDRRIEVGARLAF
jgi:iron complex outermembrane recepter protein